MLFRLNFISLLSYFFMFVILKIMNWWIVIREYFDCDKYKKLYLDYKTENEELKRLLQELTNNQNEIIKLIKIN